MEHSIDIMCKNSNNKSSKNLFITPPEALASSSPSLTPIRYKSKSLNSKSSADEKFVKRNIGLEEEKTKFSSISLPPTTLNNNSTALTTAIAKSSNQDSSVDDNNTLTQDKSNLHNRRSGIVLTPNVFSSEEATLGVEKESGQKNKCTLSSFIKKVRKSGEICKARDHLLIQNCKIRRIGTYCKYKKLKEKLVVLWEHTESPYDKSRLEYYDIPSNVKKRIRKLNMAAGVVKSEVDNNNRIQDIVDGGLNSKAETKETYSIQNTILQDYLKDLLLLGNSNNNSNTLPGGLNHSNRSEENNTTISFSPPGGVAATFKLGKPRRIIYLKDCFSIGSSIATTRRLAVQELIKKTQTDSNLLSYSNYSADYDPTYPEDTDRQHQNTFGLRDILLNAASTMTSEQLGIHMNDNKTKSKNNTCGTHNKSTLGWCVSTYSQDPYNCVTFEMRSAQEMRLWLEDLYILHQLVRQKAITFPLSPAHEWVWNVLVRARGLDDSYRLTGSYYLCLSSVDNLFTLYKFHQYYDEDAHLERDELEHYFHDKKKHNKQLNQVEGTSATETLFSELISSATFTNSITFSKSSPYNTDSGDRKRSSGSYDLLSRQDVQIAYIELCSIKRCGYSKDYFYVELGRTSSLGTGELWFKTEHELDSILIHQILLKRMKIKSSLPPDNQTSQQVVPSSLTTTTSNTSTKPKNLLLTKIAGANKMSHKSAASNILKNIMKSPVSHSPTKTATTSPAALSPAATGGGGENSASSSSGTLTYLPFYNSGVHQNILPTPNVNKSNPDDQQELPLNSSYYTHMSGMAFSDVTTSSNAKDITSGPCTCNVRESPLFLPEPLFTAARYDTSNDNNNESSLTAGNRLDSEKCFSHHDGFTGSISSSNCCGYWSSNSDRSRLNSNASSISTTENNPNNFCILKARMTETDFLSPLTSPPSSQPCSPPPSPQPLFSTTPHTFFRERALTHDFDARVEMLKTYCLKGPARNVNSNINISSSIGANVELPQQPQIETYQQKGMFSSQDSGYIDMVPSNKIISNLLLFPTTDQSYHPSPYTSMSPPHVATTSKVPLLDNVLPVPADSRPLPLPVDVSFDEGNFANTSTAQPLVKQMGHVDQKPPQSYGEEVGIEIVVDRPSSFSALGPPPSLTKFFRDEFNLQGPDQHDQDVITPTRNIPTSTTTPSLHLSTKTLPSSLRPLNDSFTKTSCSGSFSLEKIEQLKRKIDHRRKGGVDSFEQSTPLLIRNLEEPTNFASNHIVGKATNLPPELPPKPFLFPFGSSPSSQITSPYQYSTSAIDNSLSSLSISPSIDNYQQQQQSDDISNSSRSQRISWGPDSVLEFSPVLAKRNAPAALTNLFINPLINVSPKVVSPFVTNIVSSDSDDRIRAYSLGSRPFPFKFLKKMSTKTKQINSKGSDSTHSSINSGSSYLSKSPPTPKLNSKPNIFSRTPIIEGLILQNTATS